MAQKRSYVETCSSRGDECCDVVVGCVAEVLQRSRAMGALLVCPCMMDEEVHVRE